MSASSAVARATGDVEETARRLRRLHPWLLAGSTWSMAILGAVSGDLTSTSQLILLALAVVLLGLPHGAVDPWIVARLPHAPAPGRLGLFLATYLALAVLVLTAWSITRGWTLLAFLAVSVWHFGRLEIEDELPAVGRGGRLLRIVVRGLLPIGAPMLFRFEETRALFERVLGTPLDPAFLSPAAGAVAYTWLGFWALDIARDAGRSARRRDSTLLVAVTARLGMLAAFATLPVLLGFCLYFCLDHSVRHTLRILPCFHPTSTIRAWVRLLSRAALPTLLAVGGMIAFLPLAEGPLSDRILRVVFVGLAALTLPHTILAERAGTRPRMERWADRRSALRVRSEADVSEC